MINERESRQRIADAKAARRVDPFPALTDVWVMEGLVRIAKGRVMEGEHAENERVVLVLGQGTQRIDVDRLTRRHSVASDPSAHELDRKLHGNRITLTSAEHGTYQCMPTALDLMWAKLGDNTLEELQGHIEVRQGVEPGSFKVNSKTEALMILAELNGHATN